MVDNYLQPNAPATRAKRTGTSKARRKNFLSLFFVFNHLNVPLFFDERLLTKSASTLHHQPTC
jgi:hypothetical protein